MKKYLTWICMIACIFGLTACGSEEVTSQYDQDKKSYAESLATDAIIPLLSQFMSDEAAASFDDYTAEEIEYMVGSQNGLNVEGYAFSSAIESFHSAADSVGSIADIGAATSRIDGDQIIVEVEITGAEKDAVAEVIFSNDLFMTLESAALNPVSSMGELMTGAALNTLIGMGTVFVVLILISFIISCFGIIPKIQKNIAEKKAKKAGAQENEPAESAAVVQAAEESSGDDDQELAAVIAAAIAAYEGSASADGFVVRSIRRYR